MANVAKFKLVYFDVSHAEVKKCQHSDNWWAGGLSINLFPLCIILLDGFQINISFHSFWKKPSPSIGTLVIQIILHAFQFIYFYF